jgi:hypothetical protein
MRPSTTAILATAAAAASMVLLAGCGGDGPEGAPPPPATTKAAPARNAAADTPRLFVVDANGNDAREAYLQRVDKCAAVSWAPGMGSPTGWMTCVLNTVGATFLEDRPYPSFKVETNAR